MSQIQILSPTNGTSLPIDHPVTFSGSADPVVSSVSLFADDTIPLGDASLANGTWTLVRLFSSSGNRKITAQAKDGQGAVIASTSITIKLLASHHFGYTPPAGMRPHLGAITQLIELGTQLTPNLIGLEFMAKLPDSQIYFQSDLDLDTDGKDDPNIHYEPTHQSQTSIDPTGQNVDANQVPYFVLPGNFGGGHGISLGDVAAVLYKGRIEFAVFADTGPKTKIGEGSIALHRSLGFERVRPNGHILDAGIDSGVVTIVFPGSGNGKAQTPAAIRAIGQQLFTGIGGVLP